MAQEDKVFGVRTMPGDATSLHGISIKGMLDAVDLPIIVISRDCKVADVNRAAATVLGLTVSNIGRSPSNILPGMEDLDRLCAQVIADGAPCRREVRDGDRCFLHRIAPYTGSDHQIVGAVLTFTNVTAFRASIDQAIYEREYTKAILNTVIDPLVVLDAKLRVQTANRAFYAMFGVSRDETQGVSIRKLGNNEWETSEMWESIEATLSNRTEFQAVEIDREFSAIGRRTVVLDARRLARDGDALILLAFRDITERQQAERSVVEQSRLLDLSNDAILVRDAGDRITYWNKGASELYGFSREEAFDRVSHDLLSTEFPEPLECIREELRRENRWTGELIHKRKDGSRITVLSRWVLDRDRYGNPHGVLETNNDITEQKSAEEALRQSEQRFRALVNASSYVVYRMSPDWAEMRQLNGRDFISDTESPRKDWLQEYIDPDDQPMVMQAIQNAVRTKTSFQLEHRIRRVDGTLGWALSRAVPLLDASGEITEWFGAASDVTARKKAEEDYRKLAETLESEVRARTRELEQRSADVLTQSEQLRELSWQLLRTQDEERRRIARELHDSAGQLLAVLSMSLTNLRESAKQRAPGLVESVAQSDHLLQQLTREIRTTSYLLHPPLLDELGLSGAVTWYVNGLRERSELKIDLDISEHFGRLPADMELVVFRVVQECLTNIHRHSQSKTAFIRIAREPGRIVAEVRDQGKGIPPETLAEIQSRGSGVGIRGMRERLRQFLGEMTIKSSATGTTVLVVIPNLTEVRAAPPPR